MKGVPGTILDVGFTARCNGMVWEVLGTEVAGTTPVMRLAWTFP
jgi:hypothetical protein